MQRPPAHARSTRSGTRTSCAAETAETPAVLYVDLHLVHEVTSPQAFAELRARGLRCGGPSARWRRWTTPSRRALGPDGRRALAEGAAREQVAALEANCREFGIAALPRGRRAPGHRARDRAGAGPHAARHRPSSAATATPARTAPSARWPSASARARSATCSPRSACCSASRRRFAVEVDGRARAGRHRQGPDPGADRPDRHRRRHRPRRSSTAAAPSARSRWKSA